MEKEKDLFSEGLDKKETSEGVKLAMKDSSIVTSKTINRVDVVSHTEHEINCNLAVVGDAIIKVIQSEVLMDRKENNLSEARKRYECNITFAEIVAKKYEMIERKVIDHSLTNDKMPIDYVCEKGKSGDFLATAVEAMIGAIYKETGNMKSIKELIIKGMQGRDEYDKSFPEKRLNCNI